MGRLAVIIFAFACVLLTSTIVYAGDFDKGWIEPGGSFSFTAEPYREISEILVVWTDAGGDAVGSLELGGRKFDSIAVGSGEKGVEAVFPVHGIFSADSLEGCIRIKEDTAKVFSVKVNYAGPCMNNSKWTHYFNRWFEPGQSAHFYLDHNKKVRNVSVRWTDEGGNAYGTVYINYRLVGSRMVPDSEYGMTDYFYPFNIETGVMASGRIDIRTDRAKIFNVYVSYDYSYQPN